MASEYEQLVNDIYSGKDEDTQVSTPPAESTPADDKQPTETPASADDRQPTETPASVETKPSEEPPKKPSEYTPQERAEFAFRRQLSKQREKYEAQLKEQSDKFADLQKQFDEFKKSTAPKTTLKREDFPDDEEFIRALQKDAIEKALAERDAKEAEDAKKKAEEAEMAEANRKELEQQRKMWLDNVSTAFKGDDARKDAFSKRVQYCLERGLGDILDRVPVASDFLLYNPRGPIVFEKMLNDRAAFESVFNERETNPMGVYYALRKLDESIEAEKPAAPAAPAAPATQTPQTPTTQTVHIGKPGKQSSSNAKPSIFEDDDEMLRYLRSQY